jgi:PTH1 family peptidyl-tRNA hydrolase
MEVGKIRGPKKETGSGGHMGVESVSASLGGKNYWQLKIGIGRSSDNIDPEVYVLQNFKKSEQEIISQSVAKAIDKIEEWIKI